MDEQAQRMLEREHRDASATAEAAPEIEERLSAKHAQLERVRRERGQAQASGDTRRAAKLGVRAERIEGEVAREQQTLNTARRTVDDGEKAKRGTGNVYTREQAEQRARFLDAQAALPAGGAGGGEQRDYAGMAGLAGYGRKGYEGLDPRGQRAARLEIDRELALRKELSATARDVAMGDQGRLGRREQRKVDKRFDSRLNEGMREGGHRMPSSRDKRSGFDSWLQDGRSERRSAGAGESSVMRDAREVATRRKRQLGREPRR
jgi:hypothetical protein